MSSEVISHVSTELTQIYQTHSTVNLSLKYVLQLPKLANIKLNEPDSIRGTNSPYWIDWTEEIGAWVSGDGSDIQILITDDARNMDIGELTLGFTSVVTGICLNLQGKAAIHANSVSLNDKAVAFVGYSGRGKSTLSAYCASRGAGFVTDDVLVVNSDGFAIPGNPRIKLYPHTAKSLGFDTSQKTKYKIFYPPEKIGAKLHHELVPMGTIYLLEVSEDNKISSEQITASQAVFELLFHGYDVQDFIPRNPQLLHAYTKLVEQVPVKKLFYPRDFSMLPEVYNFLLEEIHNL
ncbi:MAG: hypothetical protein WBA39_03110 [Rivularia sp. (in: cyanobacteria)]